MGQDESFGQVAKFAKAALEKMTELLIPQNPRNFTIWYHYSRGDVSELNGTLDHLIERGRAFTPEKNEELFLRFFPSGEGDAAVTTAMGRLSLELDALVDQLDKAGESTAAYSSALEMFGARLNASTAGAPIDLGKFVAGMLAATRAMEKRNHEMEERLAMSSEQVVQLRDELENRTREALTDPLTGLSNRKMLDLELARLAGDSTKSGDALTALVLDIDHFKRFNDTYGHAVGDQVLKLLAATLKEGIKGRDIAVRYGGEEFVILLPETDLPAAENLANALRERVCKKRILNRASGEYLGEITISVGIGRYRAGETLEDFFTRADKALYCAKQSGRNRVVREDKMTVANAA